jgi:nucleoside-diphosphate-sugar epimerase
MTTRVFVAGATGVLGRYALPSLVEAGHDLTGVARTAEKAAWLEHAGARPVSLDLFDATAVREAVRGHDVVINLATAVPRPGPAMFLPWAWHEMDRVRREVSANLVSAALAGDTVGRVIQESFAPIYADGGDAWLDESAPVRPARYNRTALAAEGQVERFTRAGRVGVALRFGMLYGPEDAWTALLLEAIRRGWFPLPGRPNAYGSWTEHGDAGRAVAAALDIPAGVYNVVEDEPAPRREVARGIATLLGVREPRFLPPWTTVLAGVVGGILARSLRISNRKLRSASAWAPRYPTTVAGLAAVVGRAPQ